MRTHYQSLVARRAGRALLLAALSLLVGSAWAQPHVVTSIPPYVDLIERVAGPDAEVVALLPPGASPHGYRPAPSDSVRVHDADLIVLNGGIDAWLEDLVDAAGGDAARLRVLDALALDAQGEDRDDAHDDQDHAHDEEDGIDPHVWLDPVHMQAFVPVLAEALAERDPAGAAGYRERAAVLQRELDALLEELEARLAPVAGLPFVPFHGAWSHFAARFELDLVMEIEPFPGREPTPRRLADAVAALRETGARAVFNESQLPDRPARVLADEAGVALATLDPLGGVPGRVRYEDLLRFNADAVAAALGEGGAR